MVTGANSGAVVRFILMNLVDLASVRQAAEQLLAEVPRNDAFIEVAAIAQIATQKLTKDGYDCWLGTNRCGHFALTRPIFDRLVESGARIGLIVPEDHPQALSAKETGVTLVL